MIDFYNRKSRYKVLTEKKRAVAFTEKFENILSVIIGMLASIGVIRALIQATT
tara:strand:- start:34 stop:192 length:159 start_codon:yes stop_codon:yes gene_type:complete